MIRTVKSFNGAMSTFKGAFDTKSLHHSPPPINNQKTFQRCKKSYIQHLKSAIDCAGCACSSFRESFFMLCTAQYEKSFPKWATIYYICARGPNFLKSTQDTRSSTHLRWSILIRNDDRRRNMVLSAPSGVFLDKRFGGRHEFELYTNAWDVER